MCAIDNNNNAVGDLAALVWGHVVSEPVVRDASVDGEDLIADLGARGVWELQAMTLFDIHVVDADAKSYLSHSPIFTQQRLSRWICKTVVLMNVE